MPLRYFVLWTLLLVAACEARPPEHLSNFQNEYVCDSNVRLVRPLTVYDVQKAVVRHSRVKAMGTGHSWNYMFCAESPSTAEEDSGTAANLVMTTIRPLTIKVDEEDSAAWVSAGVTVWDLMEYLGNFVTPLAPRGYAIKEPPNYVNQTVAGAVATGTHGSSLIYSSVSNQVVGFRVVLANGTLAELLPETHPFLFKAFQVNVGRLGVVTEVKMRIHPETLVRRTLRLGVLPEEFLPRLKEAQETYKSTNSLPAWLNIVSSFFWSSVSSEFLIATLEEVEEPSPAAELTMPAESPAHKSEEFLAFYAKINAPVNLSRSEDGRDVADGVTWTPPTPLEPDLTYSDPNLTASAVPAFFAAYEQFFGNTTAETHKAALVPPISAIQNDVLQDAYEFAVPVDKMADCLEGFIVLALQEAPDNGLRSAPVFRFVGKEDGLLSVSHDKPHLWFDFGDYVYYNQETRRSNVQHKKLAAFLLSGPLCSPVRLHWGKSGFPDSGCWNGAETFRETWCDFGCAALALDPYGKFVGSDPNLWNWEGANLETCCTADGYDTSLEGCTCNVVPVRTPEECPEAPFYTNR